MKFFSVSAAKMRQCIILALFVILSSQLALSDVQNNNDLSYEDYFLYPKRGPYSELYRETRYPEYRKFGLEQLRKAKAQIPQGSEMFSLEMIGVSECPDFSFTKTTYFGIKKLIVYYLI